METISDARNCVAKAWPSIVTECCQILGSELHYQAMIYHLLRTRGEVPVTQLGMNVKMWIDKPKMKLFRKLDARKHEGFRGGFEPILDICLFSPAISGDWRRRNNQQTLSALLVAIEIKASERKDSRLTAGEVTGDIYKLAAHRDEAEACGSSFYPVMMVLDTAPKDSERMTAYSLSASKSAACDMNVAFLYISQDADSSTLTDG